ncbi:MAG: GMC family oxidoreductase [Desulfobacterales bacterium]|nr:GMC family oxidoreductase [Desulfobacterales bacterium]MBF0397150.1 GMC family oxidoreductase [Desulfobacterales bacterium]
MENLNKKEFDVIVVGSGPGGATVARELTLAGKKVLLLEQGSNAPVTGSMFQTIRWLGIPFRSLLFTYNALGMVRGITTGGSSVYYYGTAFEPPHDMLNRYNVDIKAEVEETKKELPIAPLSDDLTGPMAKRIMESANSLGYNWQKLTKFIFQDRCRQDCWRCNYGCPYGAKWNARNYVEDAFRKGLTLINGAKVTKVIIENGKAVGVDYKRRLIPQKAYAPLIIISAGGIGTPVILRATGIKKAGFNFFFDPLIAVSGTVKDITGGKEVPMVAGMHMQEDGYVMTDMTVPSALYGGFAAQVGRFDRIMSHKHTLTIMIKEKDSLGGQLTDRGGVRKRLLESDYQSLLRGYERAKKILKNAGAKSIFKSWYIAAHPGGTAKINDIIDSNLKTEFDNLYVCDCSVIPESFGLPPTLTLIGLGKRLAKHLCAKTQI